MEPIGSWARAISAALRTNWNRKRFSVLVISTFALGIAANVSVFTLLDGVLFAPLPFPEDDELVIIWETHPERGFDRLPAAPGKFQDWKLEEGLFSSLALFRTDAIDAQLGDEARRMSVGHILPEYFSTLGLEPLLGRGFQADEAVPGNHQVLVLSHSFWVDWAGADPNVLGRSLSLDGEPHTVVGVAPPALNFPKNVDFFRPLALESPDSRSEYAYRALARLAPGITVEQAQVRMEGVAARLALERPDTDAGFGVLVQTLREQVMGARTGSALLLFQGAVGVLLLIACANVASLMMVRATGRARETAVRLALGAGRRSLVSQWVAEGLVLAVAGAALGIVASLYLTRAILLAAPVGFPEVSAPINGHALVFTLAITLTSGLIFGVIPAWGGLRNSPAQVLRGTSQGTTVKHGRGRRAFVVAEVGLATVLVVGSTLFLKSLDRLGNVDPGFNPAGVLATEIRPSPDRYPEEDTRLNLYRQLVRTLEEKPGIVSAAAINYIPMGGRSDGFRFQIEGRPVDRFSDLLITHLRSATDEYFTTMGITIARGRPFDARDRDGTELVGIVSQTMADRFWPGEEALDQRVSLNGEDGPWVRIVGILDNVRHGGLEAEVEPEFYVPLAQDTWRAVSVVAKLADGETGGATLVREAVQEVDPLLTLASVVDMESLLDGSRAPWRFQATVVSAFGLMASLLACLGVFGLLNVYVQERARDLGVRRALGASSAHVIQLVMGRLLRLVGAGVVVGLFIAMGVSQAIQALLFDVAPLDPASYIVAALILVSSGSIAGWLPARWATRYPPARVLQAD